jgi:hypothetical protein
LDGILDGTLDGTLKVVEDERRPVLLTRPLRRWRRRRNSGRLTARLR